MTKDEALQFLREHQPLPPDLQLDRKTFKKYEEVRDYFFENPDPECVPLFLRSFGEGSGLGIYQLIEHVIAKHEKSDVVPHILTNLKDEISSIVRWNVEISSAFPCSELIEPLTKYLSYDDQDLKYSAITSLEQIDDQRAKDALIESLSKEKDEEIRRLLKGVLGSA